jgi:serine/threonine-protein kinase RsbW
MTQALTVKNNRSEIPRMARIVSDFCGRNQLPASVESDLNLALEEIVINVMAHGYADNRDHEIGVRLDLQDGTLTVRVEDDGLPFNPLEAPPANLAVPPNERRAGGLGIHFVKTLMDRLQYQRLGNKNVLVMQKQMGERSA